MPYLIMLILVLYLRVKQVRGGGKYVLVLGQNGFTVLAVEANGKNKEEYF